jgi:inner membrane protein
METNENNTTRQMRSGFQEFMRSHTARFFIIGVISLVLLIPLEQLGHLIDERKMRQEDVTDELKTEWGGPVDYYGIVIKVPVTETLTLQVIRNGKAHMETKTSHHTGYIYPQTTSEKIVTTVTEKYRGIFSTPVFTSAISGKARFDLSSLPENYGGKHLDWSKAQIAFLTNKDARFRELSDIRLNGKSFPIDYQEALPSDDILLNATKPMRIDPSTGKMLEVELKTSINGSQAIHYQPLATKSTMTMSSNWKHPAFAGTSLPDGNTTSVGENGFTGSWNTIEIGNGRSALHLDKITSFSRKFSDIRFIKLVDHYQLNERTVKYGLLVLTLTFAVFFLIQIVGKVMIHPLHYFMIGLALLLFYSLLLSFSEQLGFIPAYIIASVTIVALIVWYARSVLRSMKFAVMSGLSLGLLYAFLLVIVNLEVYALIVGSIGLLLVLAAIMSVTRKINFDN